MTAVQFRNPEVRLSEALAATHREISGHQVTLRQLLALVGEQGLLVFCAILAMPFLLPVTLPFMSTALGAPDAADRCRRDAEPGALAARPVARSRAAER